MSDSGLRVSRHAQLSDVSTPHVLADLESAVCSETELAARVPSGIIHTWHGTIANIPSGFVICDGNNSTPNLLTKFVQGVATAATNPGATGGAVSHSHTVTRGFDNTACQFPGADSYNIGESGATSADDGRPPFYDVAFLMKT